MGSVLGSVSPAQMASGRPRNRFEHRGGSAAGIALPAVLGRARFGRAPALAASEGAGPRVDLTAYPQSCCAAPPCLGHARDRWGRVHIRRPPRSRHLGRLMPPLRPVSCSLFVPVRWRCCPGGGAMGSRVGGIRSLSGHPDTPENKERKMPKTKGRLGAHGARSWTH